MRVYKSTLLTLALFLLLSPIISIALNASPDVSAGGSEDGTALQDSAQGAIKTDAEEGSDTAGYEPIVYTIIIEGAIGTVTDDRIEEAIDIADEEDAELLVIMLDTPGGFTKPTWSICKNFLNSPVPIAVYIAPSGARAGSAGVYMTYAAHFAAMAPSTNIGAAHPVSGDGEEIDSVMNEKITNDAAAQIRAAATKRGRNAEWAERAVRESVAITDVEALDSNVIDIRAVDLEDLIAQIDGRNVELPDGDREMQLKNATTRNIETSWVFKILDILTQPDIAFILFSIGSLGLMLELYNPGSIFPGVVGAISLILAFYAFQTLPINYAGVALIVLAIILFIAEIKVVSHGLLTVGGLISLFLGGLMLIDTVDPNLGVSLSVLVTVVACVGAVVIAAGWLVIKASKRQVATGYEGLIGKIAEVRKTNYVYVDGALWKARAIDNESLSVGAEVEVVAVDGLVLKVKATNS